MSKSILLMLCVLTGLLVLACAKSEETNRNATLTTNTAAPAPSPAHTETAPTTTSADKIGIEECDSFLASYDNCVTNKVPEAARAQYKTALATWRTEWKKLADNPSTKPTLANICKTNLETARTQFKSFGCTF